MPLIEEKSRVEDDILTLTINCDLCNLQIYYNYIDHQYDPIAARNGVYICSICSRKMLLNDLRSLSFDGEENNE